MSLGYEPREVRPRAVFLALGLAAIALVILSVQVWYVFKHFRTEFENRDVRRSQVSLPQTAPQEPLLEVSPTANWETYKAAQQKELESYGWVSRDERRVRIPIERAMEKVAHPSGVR
jgi:hypothetical protein